MNGNAYEERLGTDRMLPLVFRMALPAVAAQIANLLYSIVDRIFIGHIPGIGTTQSAMPPNTFQSICSAPFSSRQPRD